MRRLNIAIVEDEAVHQEMFRKYVTRYAAEHSLDIVVECFYDGLDITEGYEPKWDIILLDIKMKHQDGMTAARLIRRHDERVAIIFITTLAQYAVHSYEVDALDYVLKPVDYEKFAVRFARALRRIEEYVAEDRAFLLLPAEDGRDRVEIRRIRYVDVERHTLRVHVADDGDGTYVGDIIRAIDETVYELRRSIGSMEDELSKYHFCRCDQSVLVNLAAVTHIGRDTVELGDTRLPVSRPRRKAFLAAFAEYMG